MRHAVEPHGRAALAPKARESDGSGRAIFFS
jgi:hypothetical protein